MVPATIKLGSAGPDVAKWRALLAGAGFPVPSGEAFDAITDEYTRAWQQQKHLVVDGIVGPASWAAMLGQPAPVATTGRFASDETHREGRRVLEAIWESVTGERPSLAELQIAGAQAQLESNYGRSPYQLLDHATSAVIAKSGVINNWGAVQTSDASQGFLATDTSPNKRTSDNPKGYYDHLYRVYASPEEGARHFLEHMTLKRPTSWQLMKTGDIDGWAEQMHRTDPKTGIGLYFEQDPSQRARGIELRIAEIASAMGEPVAARRGGPVTPEIASGSGSTATSGVVAVLVAIAGAVAWWLWGRR